MSVTGIFLETDVRPPLGTVRSITLVWGIDTLTCKVRVSRHAPDGIGLIFVQPETSFLTAVQEILAWATPVDPDPAHA